MLIHQLLLGCQIALVARALALPSHHTFSTVTGSYGTRSLLSPTTSPGIISSTNSSWANITNPANFGVFCFRQDSHIPFPARISTVNDCYAAVTNIIFDPTALLPEIWSSIRGRRQLPFHWSYRSCMISIALDRQGAEDFFPLALVAQTAAAIIKICLVEYGDLLGGIAKIGPQQWMDLIVSSPYMSDTMGVIPIHENRQV